MPGYTKFVITTYAYPNSFNIFKNESNEAYKLRGKVDILVEIKAHIIHRALQDAPTVNGFIS